MKKILIIVCICLLASCSKANNETAYIAFLTMLTENGFTYSEDNRFYASSYTFSTEPKRLLIGGEKVFVLEYASNELMENDAALVSTCGSQIGNSSISWAGFPHFFKKDSIIVYYIGENERIIDFLNDNLGESFAGYSLYVSMHEHIGLGTNSITHSANDFELTLFSDKKVYKTTDAIHIWATLKYVGDNDTITIWHGKPYILFSITDGKDFNTIVFIQQILIETVLEKGELYHFDYRKIGGWYNDAPDASFWESFYQERNLYLPEGEYTVSVSGEFGLTEKTSESPSGLLCELKIKVEQ